MVAQTVAVAFSPMARKAKGPKTDQINFRFKVDVIEAMEDFKERHPIHPTLTQIAEAAVVEWIEKHRAELPPKKGTKG